jgi:hypothetical protein
LNLLAIFLPKFQEDFAEHGIRIFLIRDIFETNQIPYGLFPKPLKEDSFSVSIILRIISGI